MTKNSYIYSYSHRITKTKSKTYIWIQNIYLSLDIWNAKGNKYIKYIYIQRSGMYGKPAKNRGYIVVAF